MVSYAGNVQVTKLPLVRGTWIGTCGWGFVGMADQKVQGTHYHRAADSFVTEAIQQRPNLRRPSFWLRLGPYRRLPRAVVCTDRHGCFRSCSNVLKRPCRHMAIWICEREITALRIFSFSSCKQEFLFLGVVNTLRF